MTHRRELSDDEISRAIGDFLHKFNMRREQKGKGVLLSTHEIRGCVDEEHQELMEALHDRNIPSIEWELLDVAVAAVFSYACVRARKLDY